MILVDNTNHVDIDGSADDVIIQSLFAASAAAVYCAGKSRLSVSEVLIMIITLISNRGIDIADLVPAAAVSAAGVHIPPEGRTADIKRQGEKGK